MRPACEVLVFGDEAGTADAVRETALRHVPAVACNERGTPLVSDLFAAAERRARTRVLVYANSDMILLDNFIGSLPRDVRTYQRMPHYVVQPAVERGDAIIFTEAVIHGTVPWTAEHERIAVVCKYSPGHSAWMGTYYDPTAYPGLTEQQRRILTPPSVGERPDSVGG